WFDFWFVQIFKISLLPVVRDGADRRNVQTMRGLHVRRVVKAADESVSRNIDRAFNVAVAPQGKIRQPAIAGRHAKLHRRARSRHWQIEGVLEFDLLSLSEAKLSGDVRDGLLRKHDRSRMNRANTAGKLNVFDRFGEALQATAILLKKTQAWPTDLVVNQEPDQSFMTEHRRDGDLAL